MSASVEVVHRAYEAFNAHDLEALVALLDPDVEWVPLLIGVEGDIYVGHDGFRRYWQQMRDVFEHLHSEPDEMVDLGDAVLVTALLSGRGSGSGASVERSLAQLWRLRDGKVTSFRVYPSKQAALVELEREGS